MHRQIHSAVRRFRSEETTHIPKCHATVRYVSRRPESIAQIFETPDPFLCNAGRRARLAVSDALPAGYQDSEYPLIHIL